MKRWRWLFVMAAALTAGAASAAAQGLLPMPTAPTEGQNRDLPVQIDAAKLEIHDKSRTATFSGHVQVVQGDTTMRCKTLVVFYGQELGISGDPASTGSTKRTSAALPGAQNIRRIEAHGDVTVVSKDQSASGDLGVYDLGAKTITLSGNVVVRQGQNVIRGERVVVDTVTGNAHVESAPGTTRGRVRALIIPNKSQNGGSSNYMTLGPAPRTN